MAIPKPYTQEETEEYFNALRTQTQTQKEVKVSKDKKSPRVSVLQQANEIIYGDREQTYGSPDKNLVTIAQYWSTHLRSKYDQPIALTVDDVTVMMMQLKIARLATSPKHEDSLVDICGYAALADRCNNL